MPLTLEKLRSRTLPFELEVMGEPVIGTWAPARYSGEMDELAADLVEENEGADDEAASLEAEAIELELAGNVQGAELKRRAIRRVLKSKTRRDMRHLRALLSTILVAWDLMDGEKPYPTDEASLRKLPDFFVTAVFLAISAENRVDPTKAPNSPDLSNTPGSSEQNPPGTDSSAEPTTSPSLPGNLSPGSPSPDITPSGDAGLS